jgi:hypothetical protein
MSRNIKRELMTTRTPAPAESFFSSFVHPTMSLPSVSESSNALSTALAELDGAVKAYSDAQWAYSEAEKTRKKDYNLDRLGAKRDEQFRLSFKTLCKTVRIGSETSRLLPRDLDTLIERAAEAEDALVQVSDLVGGEDVGGNDRVACDNKLEDGMMSGAGGLMGMNFFPFDICWSFF